MTEYHPSQAISTQKQPVILFLSSNKKQRNEKKMNHQHHAHVYKRYELKNPCHPNLFKKENSTQNRVFSLNLISIILYPAPMNNWKPTQVIDWERVRNQHGYWTYDKTPDPERKTKLLENEPCQWLLMHIIEAKSAVKYVSLLFYFNDIMVSVLAKRIYDPLSTHYYPQ